MTRKPGSPKDLKFDGTVVCGEAGLIKACALKDVALELFGAVRQHMSVITRLGQDAAFYNRVPASLPGTKIIERTFAQSHKFRRRRVRYDKFSDLLDAFLISALPHPRALPQKLISLDVLGWRFRFALSRYRHRFTNNSL